MVGAFSDGKSALMLVTARLKYVAESEWGRPPLPGRDAAEGVAAPDGGPLVLSECAQENARYLHCERVLLYSFHCGLRPLESFSWSKEFLGRGPFLFRIFLTPQFATQFMT